MARPESTNDAVADLQAAASLIRLEHMADDPKQRMWRWFADRFEAAAYECIQRGRTWKPVEWGRFNDAASAARNYLDTGGMPRLSPAVVIRYLGDGSKRLESREAALEWIDEGYAVTVHGSWRSHSLYVTVSRYGMNPEGARYNTPGLARAFAAVVAAAAALIPGED